MLLPTVVRTTDREALENWLGRKAPVGAGYGWMWEWGSRGGRRQAKKERKEGREGERKKEMRSPPSVLTREDSERCNRKSRQVEFYQQKTERQGRECPLLATYHS